jgi:hypothetical protein
MTQVNRTEWHKMEELLQLLQQYKGMNDSGGIFGLNADPISDIQHYRVSPTRGYLAQLGGLIQAPASIVQPDYNYVPTQSSIYDRANFIVNQLENERSQEKFKKLKTRGLSGEAKEQAKKWNNFLDLSGLKGQKVTEEVQDMILRGDPAIPNIGVLDLQSGGAVSPFSSVTSTPANPDTRLLGERVRANPNFSGRAMDPVIRGYVDHVYNPRLTGKVFELDNEKRDDPRLEARRVEWNRRVKEQGLEGQPMDTGLIEYLDTIRILKDNGVQTNPYTGDPFGYGGEVEKVFLGKLFKGIGQGFKGIADFGLGLLGAPDVIQNSFVDRSKFLTKANGFLGGIGRTALSVANPLLGAAVGMGGRLLNGAGGQNQGAAGMMQGSGMLGGMGGIQMPQFSGTGSPYQATFGQDIFGRQALTFQDGGMVQAIPEGFKGIQTERYKGISEFAVLPDLNMAKVNATKPHEKMEDDDITDIVPVGTYIASARPDMAIKREALAEFIVGIKAQRYEEDKVAKEPELVTAADLLRKKEKKIIPAEYAKRVRDKFNTVNKEENSDIFTEKTNQENRINRTPYLQALMTIGERNRENKEDNQLLAQLVGSIEELQQGGAVQRLGYSDGSPFQNRDSISIQGNVIDMSNTGKALTLKPNVGRSIKALPYSGMHIFPGATSVKEVPVFQWGGRVHPYQEGGNIGNILGVAASALPFLSNLFTGNANSQTSNPMASALTLGSLPLSTYGTIQNVNAQQSALDNTLGNLTNLNSDLLNLNNQGTLAGIGSQLAQTTDLPGINFDFSALQNFNTQTPRSFIDAAATPTLSTSAALSSLGTRGATALLSNNAATTMQARNQAAAQQFNADRSLDYQRVGALTEGRNREQLLNNQIQQQEIAARNNVIGNIGGQVQGNLSNRANILNDTFRTGSELALQRAQLAGQIPMSIAQNMLNAGSMYQTMLGQNMQNPGAQQQGAGSLAQQLGTGLGNAFSSSGGGNGVPGMGQGVDIAGSLFGPATQQGGGLGALLSGANWGIGSGANSGIGGGVNPLGIPIPMPGGGNFYLPPFIPG